MTVEINNYKTFKHTCDKCKVISFKEIKNPIQLNYIPKKWGTIILNRVYFEVDYYELKEELLLCENCFEQTKSFLGIVE